MTQTLGQRLKQKRLDAGLTQQQVALAYGCTKQFVCLVEQGKKPPPKSWAIFKVTVDLSEYERILQKLCKMVDTQNAM